MANHCALRKRKGAARGVRPQGECGDVAEWSKAHAWKVCRRGTVSRVRIPLCPPLAPAKAFSRPSCGRIFPLFSGVMRVGLSTGSGPRETGSVLSGPIFSGPAAFAFLVKRL